MLAQILTSATVIIMQITDLKPICPCQKSSKRVDISSAFNSNLSDSYWPTTNPSFQCIWISSERFLESEIELILLPDFNSFAGFLWKPGYTFRMKTHACLWYDQNLLCTTKKTGRRGQFAQLTNLEPHGTYPKKNVSFFICFFLAVIVVTKLWQWLSLNQFKHRHWWRDLWCFKEVASAKWKLDCEWSEVGKFVHQD